MPDVQFLFNGIYHMENVWLGYLDAARRPLDQAALDNGGGTTMSVYEGKQYRTGFYAIGFGVAYNKELFEQAGLDPEAPPTTWDEFLAACEKLKAAGKIPIGGGVKDGFFGEWYFVNSLTQNLDSPPTRSTCSSASSTGANPSTTSTGSSSRSSRQGLLQRRRHLAGALPGHPAVRHRQGVDVHQHRPALPNSQKQLGADKVGFMMLPTFGTGAMAGKPITDTQGFGIPSKAKNHETAARLLDFMHSPERVQAMWTTSKQIPANQHFDPR